MNKKFLQFFTPMVISLLVAGCAGQGEEPAPVVPAELSTVASGDATYRDILEEPVTLVDGHYVGEPFVEGGASRPTVTLMAEPAIAYGDLNGGGPLEAVVLLASDSGGSGTFIYLSAMEARDGAPYNVATTLLGDRDQPQTLAITDGRVVVELLSHDDDDPACCPTVETVREFTLDGEILVEVD